VEVFLLSYQGFFSFLADVWEILTLRTVQHLTPHTISLKDSFVRKRYSLRLPLINYMRCITFFEDGNHSLHPSC